MKQGLLLFFFPSFFFLSSKEGMSEIDSEALLRRDFFFPVNKRRAEEKILELNNQLIQGLNRALNPLHHPNLRDGKFFPLEFLTHVCIYSLLEPKKWQNES